MVRDKSPPERGLRGVKPTDEIREGVRISVVTACYNSVPFLDRIYRSLITQTYRNFEWVCVDDCSTDETVQRLIAMEPPGDLGMKVFRLPQNTGGPVALAVGTEHAQGDVIVWLDHDDEFFPFALQQIDSNWLRIENDKQSAGLFLRAAQPDGRLIGRELLVGSKFTWSEMTNRFPDVCDGTFAIKADLFRKFATIDEMENVVLQGVIHNKMTKNHPFILADGRPIRFYHRDNPQSQTLDERISSNTVATYARLIDNADIYFLLRPIRWLRHIASLIRYSRQVHGRWLEGLRYVNRPAIRLLVRMLLPLGVVAYLRSPIANVVEIRKFRPESAKGLRDLRLSNR